MTASTNGSMELSFPPDGKMPDTLPDQSNEHAAQLAALSPSEYAEMERKLVRKMDLRMVPWLTLLFTMSFLDRINIGTAKLAGLQKDLHMGAADYNNASVIFFVSYVAFEIPSNLLLKKMKPSRWIPFIMILWSICQVGMGLVQNFQGLLAMRFLLGFFECGLFPGISFFLSGWYKRKETSKRISVFFAGAVLAGAFGGILGYGLSKMNGIGGKAGWSWIFIIEGLLAFVIGIGSIWMVQDWPEDAKFLTPLEREMVLQRLKDDTGLASQGTFSGSVIKRAALDWKTWVLALMYIGSAQPIYAQSLFTPTIIAALGKWTTAQSLLLSTPPYVFAFITTMVTAYLSDRTGKRGFFLMFWTTVAAIGYIIYLTVPLSKPGVLYFACFLTVGAIAPCIATTIVWAGNTFGNHYKKATSMGIVFTMGNSGGIVASEVYRAANAPRYLPGHGVTLGFCILGLIMSIVLYFGLRAENARRDRVYGPVSDSSSSTQDGEKFRFTEDVESEEYLKKWGLEGMTREEIIELGDDHPAFRFIL